MQVIPYYGKKNVHKGYSTQRRIAMPEHYQNWASDKNGRPIFFYVNNSFVKFTDEVKNSVIDTVEFNAGVGFEENGYFRKSDWYENTGGVIILGEKHEKPPLGQTYRKALKLMVDISRTDTVFDRVNGIAAYDAWAEALAMDGEFPSDNEQVLRSRFMRTNMIVGSLAEMRWYGNITLQHMADPSHLSHTVSGDLLHAAAHYADIHALLMPSIRYQVLW